MSNKAYVSDALHIYVKPVIVSTGYTVFVVFSHDCTFK